MKSCSGSGDLFGDSAVVAPFYEDICTETANSLEANPK